MTAVRPMRIVPDWQLLRPLHSSLISHVSSLGSGHFAFQGPSRAPAAPASSAAPKPGVGRLFSSDVSDPVAYSKELEAKVEGVKALFEDLKLPQDVEVFPSPPTGYRLRAEFAVHHDGPECHYVMFDTSKSRKDPERVRVDTFPLASRLINELMPLVTGFVNQNEVLRKKLFGVNFHTTLSGQAMVTLLYHRRLDDGWTEQAGALRQHLASAPSLAPPLPVLIGRSRGQIVELDCSHVIEKLHVNGRDFTYRQNEGAFSQPNGVVCQHMLSWAQRVTAGSPGDLLELYCGNGNTIEARHGMYQQLAPFHANLTKQSQASAV